VLQVARGEKRPTPIPRPDNPNAVVYFVRSGDFIKIGTAGKPAKRMAELRTSSPVKLTLLLTIPGGLSVEKALHQRFAELRVRGEWFRAEPALTDFINAERTNAKHKNGYSKKTVG